MDDADYEAIEITKRKSYLRIALTQFLCFVRNVDIDYDNNEVLVELNDIEITLVGLFMYDAYLEQEIYKASKLMDIVFDAFKIGGFKDRVNNLKEFKAKNETKINSILATMI
jgi:hypothetical protein